MDAKAYLDLYRRHPQAIDPEDMDMIQGRILLNTDFLIASPQGPKIYCYNFITNSDPEQYKKELKRIISRMMLEWFTSPTSKFFQERYKIAHAALTKYSQKKRGFLYRVHQ